MRGDGAGKFGTLRGDLSSFKDRIDFRLTRFPRLYLAVEKFRVWVNWDKRVYLSFIRRGDVVLDVGANVGAHSVFFSHLVGRGGKVIAFEPLLPNLDAMRSLLARRARYDNIEVVGAAVGNPEADTRTATIRIPGSDLTQASLASHSAGSWGGGADVRLIECPITSIDRNPALQRVSRVGFIKLDVEGAELFALKGAAATIERDHPLIYCEIYRKWSQSFGYGPSELMDLVRSLGYDEARVIVDGRIHLHVLGDPTPESWFTNSSDVLFFREEHRPMVRVFDERYPPAVNDSP
jgi:FkbM family methyltransferase